MKSVLVTLSVIFILSACAINKDLGNGVYALDSKTIDKLKIGEDKSTDLKKSLGNPVGKNFEKEQGFDFTYVMKDDQFVVLTFDKDRILQGYEVFSKKQYEKITTISTDKRVGRLLEEPKPREIPKAETELTCRSIIDLNNKLTPIDMMTGVHDCLAKKDWQMAGQMLIATVTYFEYDKMRMKNSSQYQYGFKHFLNDSLKGTNDNDSVKVLSYMQSVLENNDGICRLMSILGKPAYEPNYMALLGYSDEHQTLGENADTQYMWKTANKRYSGCEL